MPVDWALSIVLSIFNGKSDIRNSSCCGAVKLIEHGRKVVERVLIKMINKIVTVDEMQFDFMPEKGTIDAVVLLTSLQEEYHAKRKGVYVYCGSRESF